MIKILGLKLAKRIDKIGRPKESEICLNQKFNL